MCTLLCLTIVIQSSRPDRAPPRTRTHTGHYGTYGVLDCLLYCDIMWPNYRISLGGYHCSIEFPCGVPLFYCCKYLTVPHNLWHTRSHITHMCVHYKVMLSYWGHWISALLFVMCMFAATKDQIVKLYSGRYI